MRISFNKLINNSLVLREEFEVFVLSGKIIYNDKYMDLQNPY